ncbi:hypothetical protein P4G45_01375 [Edaphobacter paludis]|uniref:Uncharacterized protein n=1 Tax=Edaphobacter paludis TaxID=3035702 RepID=A0AAU7CZR1_9BACT
MDKSAPTYSGYGNPLIENQMGERTLGNAEKTGGFAAAVKQTIYGHI